MSRIGPEKRERMSRRAKVRWDAKPESAKEAHAERSRLWWAEHPEAREASAQWWVDHPEARDRARQKWRERNPERAVVWDKVEAAIASGDLVPEPCDTCGGEARPWIDYATETVKGWRCAACWKARRSHA